MAPNTPTPLIKVDPKKKPDELTPVPHNRWHPDIPAVRVVVHYRTMHDVAAKHALVAAQGKSPA